MYMYVFIYMYVYACSRSRSHTFKANYSKTNLKLSGLLIPSLSSHYYKNYA